MRGFLVDAFLGSVRTAGDEQIVYTELTDSRLARLVKAAGDEPAQHALALRTEAGPPAADAPRDVYLCHQFCELGAVLFSDVVDVLRHFLDEHPERGRGRRHPGRARRSRAHSGARGRRSRLVPRHHRPDRPAAHPRVDGGVGASAGDRSRERRPGSSHPQRVRRRARPGGAVQVLARWRARESRARAVRIAATPTHHSSCSTISSRHRRPSSPPRPTARTFSSLVPSDAPRSAGSRSTSSPSTSTRAATSLRPWTS